MKDQVEEINLNMQILINQKYQNKHNKNQVKFV